MEVTRIEPVGIGGHGQQLLGFGGIIRVWADRQANSNVFGTMPPVAGEAPSVSALLSSCRLIAKLAASRTRRSAQGDLGSHISKKSRYGQTGGQTRGQTGGQTGGQIGGQTGR